MSICVTRWPLLWGAAKQISIMISEKMSVAKIHPGNLSPDLPMHLLGNQLKKWDLDPTQVNLIEQNRVSQVRFCDTLFSCRKKQASQTLTHDSWSLWHPIYPTKIPWVWYLIPNRGSQIKVCFDTLYWQYPTDAQLNWALGSRYPGVFQWYS